MFLYMEMLLEFQADSRYGGLAGGDMVSQFSSYVITKKLLILCPFGNSAIMTDFSPPRIIKQC